MAEFWRHLRQETRFRTLLYYHDSRCSYWIESLLRENNFTTSHLIWTHATKSHCLKLKQNLDIFGVICVGPENYKFALKDLSTMLNHRRESPLLLQIGSENQAVAITGAIARAVLLQCQELLMPNVLLLAHDFVNSGILYAHEIFPTFRVRQLIYNSNMELYPYKLHNLYGHAIRVEPNFHEPYTIASGISTGSFKITGVLWHLMNEFAKYLNATLELSYDPQIPGPAINYYATMRHIENDTVDISASVFPLQLCSVGNLHKFSYPVFLGSWCIMLPVESLLRPAEAMMGVVKSPWMWLYFGIIYCLIRWMKGQFCRRRRQLTLLWSLMQLSLVCSVLAQLSAMFIRPQHKGMIKSFEELRTANLSIVGGRNEFYMYPDEIRISYASSFISYENFTEFVELRDSFNTSYAYTIGSEKWRMYKEMQKYFRRPLFRYSSDVCIRHIAPQSLLYQENSLYCHQLNAFVLQARDCGLMNYWVSRGFYDMISAGRVSFRDLSTSVRARPLPYVDWQHVMALYTYALAIALLVFVFELSVHYVNVCLDLI
ncbi:hypothetical protein KR222_003342 [Zaprionus bogoriensis]|nr:hypothetical protein KR222_003342 [Zaprionus bogoriensis]